MAKYLVSVSGGAGSTLALHRALERYGANSLLPVFADTGSEDPTLYKLLDHMDVMLSKHGHAGVKRLNRFGAGFDIWDCFDKYGILQTPDHNSCKASLELKIIPLTEYAFSMEQGPVVVSGLDWMEEHRTKTFDERWKPLQTWHPLTEEPFLSACEMVERLAELGYPEQALYKHGYPHNNCGGTCILGGISQWHGLFLDYPERFVYAMEREEAFNAKHRRDKKPYTVLRDRNGGESTPLSLRKLKERIAANDPTLRLRDFRSNCACVLNRGEQLTFFEMLEQSKADCI